MGEHVAGGTAALPADRRMGPAAVPGAITAGPSEVELDAAMLRACRWYGLFATLAAGGLGTLALIGWIIDVPLLASLNPDWVAMKANTAIALMLAAAALFRRIPGEDETQSPAMQRIATAAAGVVLAIGGATLAEYALARDLGIDQLLFEEAPGAVGTTVPGRMAPMTAVSFTCLGAALLLPERGSAAALNLLLTLAVLFIALLSLLGYLFAAAPFYAIVPGETGAAVPTAIAFLLLSTALLTVRRRYGLLPLLASPRSGGAMLRRLSPLVIVSPVLIVWLRVQTDKMSLVAMEFTAAAAAATDLVILGGVLLWSARKLDRSDAARLRGEAMHAAALYARSLIEASLDPLVTIDAEGKITHVNKATEEATGRLGHELIGTEFADYFTEPERARAAFRQVLQSGSMADCALGLRHVSGRTMEVLCNASVYRGDTGEIAGVFAAARDVTQRKRAEDSLRASEQQYRALVETMSEGLIRVDRDWKIEFANARFAEMLGYTTAELHERDVKELIEPFDHAQMQSAISRRTKGSADKYQLVWRRRNGESVPTLVSAQPIFDAKDEYSGAYGVITDLTEIKRAEQELAGYRDHLQALVEERTAALSAANNELEAFSYSVSHDLRTPLRAIDGFSRILLEDYADKLDQEGKRVLNVVRDNTVKMGQLIDDILAFSRVGRLELNPALVDMEALVRELLADTLAPTLAGRKITIDIGKLPPAQGDRAMLSRVWSNLLENAIKFSASKADARIEIAAAVGDGETVYSVRDNGAGFDMRYADKLFGVFQRLHGTEFPGTGIGLAIVKRIVSRHGGRVWAEGKPDAGATFHFALPARS